MPYRVLLSTDEGLGVVELTGAVRWADVEAALRALFTHPAWEPAFAALWDARAITDLDISPTDLPAMRATMAALAPARSGGCSALVTHGDVEATLAVLLSRLGPPTGRRVGTFYRLRDALRFLQREEVPSETEVVVAA